VTFRGLVSSAVVAGMFGAVAIGQTTSQGPALQDGEIAAVTASLGKALQDRYPFPEISAQWSKMLAEKTSSGAYKGMSACGMDKKLTEDLQAVHKDVHLRVICNEAKEEREKRSQRPNGEQKDFGFEKVELDPETETAYIQSKGGWSSAQGTYEAAIASMNLAAHSKYIIIDLRDNGGGTGTVGRLLGSYLYKVGDEKYYLYGFEKDRTHDQQEWTYAYMPGPHMPDAKVYVLVNHKTASATEGFAYAMQKLKRVTIVGETTAGAGIAGGFAKLGSGTEWAFVPSKMIVAPHTEAGWEAVGVTPDVVTEPGQERAKAMELIEADRAKK